MSIVLSDRVLLTGATGYVGGRLRGTLEAMGVSLRCMARRPEHLATRVWSTTEVVHGDVLHPSSLRPALEGIGAAYYLVHSLGSRRSFEREELTGARNFAGAAREAGVRRIVYLGGLGSGDDLSPHLRSRQEVGRVLRESGVPTIEFRASIILGPGSLSFEMIRSLVERLPVMVTPRWTRSRAHPIAIEDVIQYLVEALRVDLPGSAVFEIGGADVVSYHDLMTEYARQRGLRRVIIPVPVLTPRLSSLWLGLVTPVFARIGRKLIESVRHDTVVTDDSASHTFGVRPRGMVDAMARALANEDRELAETRWSDALSSRGAVRGWAGVTFGHRIVDSRTVDVPVPTGVAFAPIARIGGDTGWYFANGLWRLRGFLDLLLGGVGTRRGRRDPVNLLPGDALDFWRVEAVEPGRLLRLSAEMKVPGRAWLQFEVDARDGHSTIRQTAIFDPLGLPGLAYWYILYPLHALIFRGMLRNIGRAAARQIDPPA